MNRIEKIFQYRTEKVIPFLTAGYPSKNDTLGMVLAAEKSGAAMIELGMPFSDPLADGPVIQHSSQIAIENGVDILWILDLVRSIRLKSDIPIALMGYINPIIKFGIKDFIENCSLSGVDGLIFPDMPPEEAASYVEISKENNICPILLVSPNTPNNRIKEISIISSALIYCVAVLGITGKNSIDREKLKFYLERVEKNSICPFVVGFGIEKRSDIIEINKLSHGAVVGSAIIKELNNAIDPVLKIEQFIKELVG